MGDTVIGLRNLKYSILLFALCISAAHAQNYVIGCGDVLAISFWQEPTMNFSVTVGEDSTISLPMGSSLKAAGKSPEQLAVAVVERIALYNRRITHAAVKVEDYGSRKVYVMGNVRVPNKYTFQVMPNLWEIISEAGGPTESANLSNVMIVRNGKGIGEQTISVDLADILRNRAFHLLPKVEPGDNIYVPAVVGNVPGSGMESVQEQQNVLFIYGEVGNPGVITFNKDLTLLQALVTAGGPTLDADLSKVRVIRKRGVYSAAVRVDVEAYADERAASFFSVKAGDIIFVPRKKMFRESLFGDFFMLAAGAVITAFAVSLIPRN